MSISQKKEDILHAAERLFYEYGFRGVGLKQIISEANVANMTLYNHFTSKEHLVEEVLKQREERYWSYLDKFVQVGNDTPFLNAVEAHGKWLEEESYKGDMFLRAIEDYAGGDNEIERIARSHKAKLLRYFQGLAKRIDEENYHNLAYYITLLIEGSTSMTTLIGPQEATAYAKDIAKKIVYSN